MSFERKSTDLWDKIELDSSLVENGISLALRDLHTAELLFAQEDYDWCLAVSYNAMLQAGRALMFSKGFRPKGEFKHVSVVEFLKSQSVLSEVLIFALNKARRKRHDAVYEQINLVSRGEVESTLQNAKQIVVKIKESLPLPQL